MNHDIVPVPDTMMVSIRFRQTDEDHRPGSSHVSVSDLVLTPGLEELAGLPVLTTQEVSLRTPDWTWFHKALGVLRLMNMFLFS